MSQLKYWVWLSSRHSVSSVEKAELVRAFSSAEHIYHATRDELVAACRLRPCAIKNLEDKGMDGVEAIIQACMEKRIQMLTIQDCQYPARLMEIYDPPPVLYVKGQLPLIDDYPAIALVGTRKCTAYAIGISENMGAGIANGGGIVISGLAEGVDQAALRGALKSGKPTVAVLGCGLDIDYPKSGASLRRDIEVKGALVSEYPPGTPALPHNFPPRNRIISGLSVGVAVVEAPESSGALITARLAAEQGRDVFIHPGTVEDVVNAGNYLLMRDGAKPVRTGEDILAEYVHLFPDRIKLEQAGGKKPALFHRKKAKDIPEMILDVLGDEPVHVDDIIVASKLSASDVLSNLTVMEITGAVRQLPGKRFQREPGW